MEHFISGFVSIVGRTNVGKSTFLNTLIGEKISITSFKPQTTRNRIIGVKHIENGQIIFLDTPGIHRPKHKLGEAMVKTALTACKEVDLIVMMVEPALPKEGDKFIIERIKETGKPVILLINKIDKVKKSELLPIIDAYSKLYDFEEIIPISALKAEGIEDTIEAIKKYLPEGVRYYPEDVVTDQLERFMVSEIIREKIIKHTRDEVPHSVAVEVTTWEEKRDRRGRPLIIIYADILVERNSQKNIIIGKAGNKLKQIAMEARREIEALLASKVYLNVWVKVKKKWRTDTKVLKEMGYYQ